MKNTTLALALAALVAVSASADAGCNCNRGGGAMGAPMPSMPVMRAPMMRAPMMHPPMMAPAMAGPRVAPGAACSQGGRGASYAPPGTLGRTYRFCSRPLPVDEHPRNAGLEIRIADADRIDVEKMEGFLGDDGLWYFTTEKPWLPTQPAIVKVVISRNSGGAMVRDVRVVRLIPGRILSVEF